MLQAGNIEQLLRSTIRARRIEHESPPEADDLCDQFRHLTYGVVTADADLDSLPDILGVMPLHQKHAGIR